MVLSVEHDQGALAAGDGDGLRPAGVDGQTDRSRPVAHRSGGRPASHSCHRVDHASVETSKRSAVRPTTTRRLTPHRMTLPLGPHRPNGQSIPKGSLAPADPHRGCWTDIGSAHHFRGLARHGTRYLH